MAAVLSCGPGAMLSHRSAAVLWKLLPDSAGPVDVAVRGTTSRRRPGVRLHRHLPTGPPREGSAELAPPQLHPDRIDGIPLTDPITTLVDVAAEASFDELEDVINAADRRRLVSPDRLRASLSPHAYRPGVGRLKAFLDRDTFTRTDTRLERRFLPIAAAAGLPQPQTQVHLNGYRVDFYWPELALVVETDGLTYHRTPSQQAEDIRRDQAHMAVGLVPLRFTRAQVYFEPGYVRGTLETARAQRAQR